MIDTVDLFNRVSRWYDFINKVISFGFDIYWRKDAVSRLLKLKNGLILDVATGTAEVAKELANQSNKVKVIGLDPAYRMLDIAKKKIENLSLADRIVLVRGDGLDLPFPDKTFDAVTIAFGVRNMPDRKKALYEMTRVLKNDGVLMILEFSKPYGKFFRVLFDVYFKFLLPNIGGLISGSKKAYMHLPESVERFPDPVSFAREIMDLGYRRLYMKYYNRGICMLYIALKGE